jgi:hypothetical protein
MCGADLFNALSELFWPWVILLGAVPWVSAGHGWKRETAPPAMPGAPRPISERIVAALGWLLVSMLTP